MNTAEETRDRVFAQETEPFDFKFNAAVATVFDDMVNRSVPYYEEMQRMIAELAADFALEKTNVYDLGCSTGTTLLNLGSYLKPAVKFIGIDNSSEMLARCRAKLEGEGFKRPYELMCTDLNDGIHIENASLVTMILTLQFIRPLYRDKLVGQILRGLNPDGCFIMVEKVIGEDSLFNRLFIKHYYEYKRRNGYSDLEISQKREALENVLVPYKLLENREMLMRAGFRYCDVFFKWYNFCGIIAVK
ncbi:MAG: carboxy-S-adenosyl-L-methionine synthase CmoA [Verrucomicrobiota bacterium]